MMDYIAIFMFGAMFSLICMVLPKMFERNHKADNTNVAPVADEKQKRLQEQWEAFMNYTGDDRGGGLDG